MSILAKIIYEETGLTQSGTPGEYEEVASACRRFALCCYPRQPLTLEEIAVAFGWKKGCLPLPHELNAARAIERAHKIGGEV